MRWLGRDKRGPQFLREGAKDNYNLVYAPCVGACDRAPVSVVGKSQVFYGDIARIKKLRDNPDKVVSLPPYQDLNSYSSQKGYIIFNQLRDQKISKLDVTEILKVSDLRGMGVRVSRYSKNGNL